MDGKRGPSWGRVYWTTFRLFVERRFGVRLHRRRLTVWGDEELPLPPARPFAFAGFVGAVLGVVALLVFGVVALVGAGSGSGGSARSQAASTETSGGAGVSGGTSAGPLPAPVMGPVASAAGGGAADEAALWVVAQVGPGRVVACDATVCAALRAHGYGGTLVPLRPRVRATAPAQIVTAVMGVAGPGLGAPRPGAVRLAAFTVEGVTVEVDTVPSAAPAGAEAAATVGRAQASAALLADPRITLTPDVRQLLSVGQLDGRVVHLLATLAAGGPVRVLAVGDAAPGADPGVPRRTVEIAASDPAALAAVVEAQPPFDRPLAVAVVDGPAGTGVLVTYAAPGQ